MHWPKVLVILVCSLTSSTLFLYIKWAASERKLALQEIKIRLIQEQLDQQMVVLNALRKLNVDNTHSIYNLEQSVAFTFLFNVVGMVTVVVICYILFSNNSNNNTDPSFGLERLLTSQNEIALKAATEQNILNAKLMTEHFENLVTNIGGQNIVLVQLIEAQTESIDKLFLKLDSISSILRQTNL